MITRVDDKTKLHKFISSKSLKRQIDHGTLILKLLVAFEGWLLFLHVVVCLWVVCDHFSVVSDLFWIQVGRLFVFVVVVASVAASSSQYYFLLLLLLLLLFDSFAFDHGSVVSAAYGLID